MTPSPTAASSSGPIGNWRSWSLAGPGPPPGTVVAVYTGSPTTADTDRAHKGSSPDGLGFESTGSGREGAIQSGPGAQGPR
jgi:hypothetical protein